MHVRQNAQKYENALQMRLLRAHTSTPLPWLIIPRTKLPVTVELRVHQRFNEAEKPAQATTAPQSTFEITDKKKNSNFRGRIYCLIQIMGLSSLAVGWNERFHKEEIE